MSRPGLHRNGNGMYEAVPGRILRSIDGALQPLIGARARDRILAVVDELDVPVNAVCYECRLRPGDSRVDVAVCLFPMRPAGVEDVLGLLGRRHLAEPPWRRCVEFLAEWSHPGSDHAAQLPFVCVAFDLPGDRAAVPVPGLSLCIDREFFARQRGLPAEPPPPASRLAALADECHRRLRGEGLPVRSLAMLENCLSGDDVLAKHVSFMLSRTPAACKLDIQLPIDSLAAVLRRIDWPGSIASVVAHIRALAPRQRRVQLNLVLVPGLDASLEVELLTSAAEAGTEERRAILQQLVDRGHCDPAKAEVLRHASIRPVHRVPEGLIVAQNWYLKVKFDGDHIAETKAYFGLMPRAWCDPRTVVDAYEVPLGSTA
jgi:hypothetical protein